MAVPTARGSSHAAHLYARVKLLQTSDQAVECPAVDDRLRELRRVLGDRAQAVAGRLLVEAVLFAERVDLDRDSRFGRACLGPPQLHAWGTAAWHSHKQRMAAASYHQTSGWQHAHGTLCANCEDLIARAWCAAPCSRMHAWARTSCGRISFCTIAAASSSL